MRLKKVEFPLPCHSRGCGNLDVENNQACMPARAGIHLIFRGSKFFSNAEVG